MIFLFKLPKSANDRAEKAGTDGGRPVAAEDVGLFFAHQVISNACATQAILSVLLNVPPTGRVQLGKELSDFKAFAADLPSDVRLWTRFL